jgi:hypothetical protein
MLKKLECDVGRGGEAEVTKEDIVARFILASQFPEIATSPAAPRNDKMGAYLAMTGGEAARDDKEERNTRCIFAALVLDLTVS